MRRTRHDEALKLAFLINTALTIIEYGAGTLSGSAVLLADGSQNLTDSLVISVTYICERMAARQFTTKKRIVAVYQLAASLNAGILMTLAVAIGILAIYRTLHPHLLNTSLVIATGVLSICINFWAASLFFSARRDSTITAPYIVCSLADSAEPEFWRLVWCLGYGESNRSMAYWALPSQLCCS